MSFHSSRRRFLQHAAAGSAACLAPSFLSAEATPRDGMPGAHQVVSPLPVPPVGPLDTLARDETYWDAVARQYPVTEAVVNFEAGYFGMMAAPVLAAYHAHLDRVNRESSFFARRAFPPLMQAAREQLAAFVGVKPTELLLSRNATEALQAIIGQYRRVGPGDVVMYADLDYNAMQWAMNALAARTGARVVTLDIPEPASHDAILAAYTAALDREPRTKLLLLTHCNNKTGLIHPVKAIADLARARGVDTVVDAAHSFGQVPLTVADLGADFVGLNVHKWLGAPVGVGAMVIREAALDRIDRAHADESAPMTRIESRLHTGTTNFATVLTIPDALDFQRQLGIERKAARLRYLRDRWVHAVRNVPGVQVLTPDDPSLVGAITGFRLHGRGTPAANAALARTLLDEFGIFTFQRTGIAKGDCVRVTPTLYNRPEDCDRLAEAIRTIAARG